MRLLAPIVLWAVVTISASVQAVPPTSGPTTATSSVDTSKHAAKAEVKDTKANTDGLTVLKASAPDTVKDKVINAGAAQGKAGQAVHPAPAATATTSGAETPKRGAQVDANDTIAKAVRPPVPAVNVVTTSNAAKDTMINSGTRQGKEGQGSHPARAATTPAPSTDATKLHGKVDAKDAKANAAVATEPAARSPDVGKGKVAHAGPPPGKEGKPKASEESARELGNPLTAPASANSTKSPARASTSATPGGRKAPRDGSGAKPDAAVNQLETPPQPGLFTRLLNAVTGSLGGTKVDPEGTKRLTRRAKRGTNRTGRGKPGDAARFGNRTAELRRQRRERMERRRASAKAAPAAKQDE